MSDTRANKENIQRVKDILNEHGITLQVDGCGCCGSPSVYFKYKDEVIINDSNVYIDMEEAA